MAKFQGKDAPDTFPSGDMFIYPLIFLVGFKLPLHLTVTELLKQFNVSPHWVVPNT